MDKETIEKYRQAGKIAAQVLDYGKNLIKKNAFLLDVTEKIEAKIFELGAERYMNYESIADKYKQLHEEQLKSVDKSG